MNRSSPLWKRWAALLDVLPERSAEALGAWLPRLALAIGPLRGEPARGEGEPDGLSGLTARGSYERLVMSEWGVAEVAPEEFIRRAAMGEHLFLRRAMRVPEQTTCSQVWIDAGPEQLGSPRLAHIALLIVLAERAAAAGVRFRWGVLQEPDIHEGLEPEHLVELMGRRSVDRAAALGLTDFLTVSDTADLWWIGGPQLREAVGLPGAVVEIEDVLDPDVRALDVHVEGQTLRLPLPASDIVLSLLRNPLVSVPDLPEPSGDIGVGMSASGSMIWLRWTDRVVAFPIPKKPRQWARPRQEVVVSEAHIVAVGWSRKRLAVLVVRDGRFHLEGMTTGRWAAPTTLDVPREFVMPEQGVRTNVLFQLPRVCGDPTLRDGFVCLDGAGQLWALAFSHGASDRLAVHVVDVRAVQNHFWVLGRDNEGYWSDVLCQRPSPQNAEGLFDDLVFQARHRSESGVDRVMLAESAARFAHAGVDLLEWTGQGSVRWSRPKGVPSVALAIPLRPGWSVVGVVPQPDYQRAATDWVVLSPDRCELRCEPSGDVVTLDDSPAEAVFMVPAERGLVAVLHSSAVIVYSPVDGRLVGIPLRST